VILVLDEAYGEFADSPDYCPGKELIPDYPNLVVTRTFSKIYGLAGLRLGYAMGQASLIQGLFRSKQAFNVNSLAQKAGVEALKDSEFIQKTLELCRQGRKYLYRALEEEGFFFYPSQANFICIKVYISLSFTHTEKRRCHLEEEPPADPVAAPRAASPVVVHFAPPRRPPASCRASSSGLIADFVSHWMTQIARPCSRLSRGLPLPAEKLAHSVTGSHLR